MGDLFPQSLELGLIERMLAREVLAKARWVLGDKGTFAQECDVFGQSLFLREGVDIAHQLVIRDSLERVLNPEPGIRKSP